MDSHDPAIQTPKDRAIERASKQAQYTKKQTNFRQAWSKAHVKPANWFDAAISTANNKYIAAAFGAVWGSAKGLVIGSLITLAISPIVTGFGLPIVGAMVLYHTISETRDFYFTSEATQGKRNGSKVAGKIMDAGHARAPLVKESVLIQAEKKLAKETARPRAEEIQYPDFNYPEVKNGPFQNRLISERQFAEQNLLQNER